jgi:hypothetical protein
VTFSLAIDRKICKENIFEVSGLLLSGFCFTLHGGISFMNQDEPASSSHIPWHPAFFQAIQLELEPYKDSLEFRSEYRLTAEPLEIDVVIIKKDPALTIEKNIARIFRQINLLEYKNSNDYFSVYDFYKVFGYVYFYAALNKTDIRDMAISIMETRYPGSCSITLKETGTAMLLNVSPVSMIYPGILSLSRSSRVRSFPCPRTCGSGVSPTT